jgi:adenylate cyclase
MEPLFLAATCACNAGSFRDALHEVYLPRIQRGDASFAAKVLGARGALLSVLVHFFEDGRWGSPLQTGLEGQRLTEEDQLLVLMQAALYLTVTRGVGSLEARLCYERAEPLCHALNRPLLLYVALIGQFRYSLNTGKLAATLQLAQQVYATVQEQSNAALKVGGYRALALTLCFMGEFESARRYARRGVRLWRSRSAPSPVEEADAPIVTCLCVEGLIKWHFGEGVACRADMAEAISVAKEQNDTHGLVMALFFVAMLDRFERRTAEVERLASDVIELSTRHHFAHWLAIGTAFRGWVRSASGEVVEGLTWIEDGIRAIRATGGMRGVAYWLAVKAEALHIAARTPEALETIQQTEALAESLDEGWWRAELQRLRGVFLASLGAEEAQVEAAFREAIATAQQQKSMPLENRAEATYAEYRRQKASRSGGRKFRLPL